MMAPMLDLQEKTVEELKRDLENEKKAHQRTKDALTASQALTTTIQKEFKDSKLLNAQNVIQMTSDFWALERKAAALETSLSEAQTEAKKAQEALKAQTARYNRHLERLNAQIRTLRREAKEAEPKASEPKATQTDLKAEGPEGPKTMPETPKAAKPEPPRPHLSPFSASVAELQEENQRLFASLLQ